MISDSSRTVEIMLGGEWTEIEFQELEEGDIFRLYYKDRLLGKYVALCDAYYNIELHEFEIAVEEVK